MINPFRFFLNLFLNTNFLGNNTEQLKFAFIAISVIIHFKQGFIAT
jgi:hypothetical protein